MRLYFQKGSSARSEGQSLNNMLACEYIAASAVRKERAPWARAFVSLFYIHQKPSLTPALYLGQNIPDPRPLCLAFFSSCLQSSLSIFIAKKVKGRRCRNSGSLKKKLAAAFACTLKSPRKENQKMLRSGKNISLQASSRPLTGVLL